MVIVHHLSTSRAHRILWLLEELEVPYELKRYQRLPTLQAPPELRAVHPLGKSPVIEDGGRRLAESGAILEYLVERYGRGRMAPPAGDEEARIQYRYWLHYAEGSLMPWLFMKLVMSRLPHPPTPALIRPVAKLLVSGMEAKLTGPQLQRHAAFIEEALGRSPWLAGDTLTAADVQMSYPLEALLGRSGLPAASFPHIAAFLERIRARPAYQRAVARGGEPMLKTQ